MAYCLREDLSFCQVDGHLVFLDIQSDRYFRLSEGLERVLLSYIESGGDQRVDISTLVTRGILVAAQGRMDCPHPISIEVPTRSAVEYESPPDRISFATTFDVWTLVLRTRPQLKLRNLKDILDRLIAHRRQHTSESGIAATDFEQRVVDAATRFTRARRSVPIETRCLLDSIAMTRYLADRQIYANIVFGVCADPFSAHCWVQSGSLVLNDTVGNVTGHIPIRVV